MKLSTLTAKLTFLKNRAFRALAVATLAGAALAAAPAAQAQHFGIGVRIGGPVYVAPRPVYVAPAPIYFHGYYGPEYRHFDGWRDHREFDHRGYWRR